LELEHARRRAANRTSWQLSSATSRFIKDNTVSDEIIGAGFLGEYTGGGTIHFAWETAAAIKLAELGPVGGREGSGLSDQGLPLQALNALQRAGWEGCRAGSAYGRCTAARSLGTATAWPLRPSSRASGLASRTPRAARPAPTHTGAAVTTRKGSPTLLRGGSRGARPATGSWGCLTRRRRKWLKPRRLDEKGLGRQQLEAVALRLAVQQRLGQRHSDGIAQANRNVVGAIVLRLAFCDMALV
jgi:hypothetical protein